MPTANWEAVTLPHTWHAIDGQAGRVPILDENHNPVKTRQAAADRNAQAQAQPNHVRI